MDKSREILAGDSNLKVEIQRVLKDTKELGEAVEAILAEEATCL